MFKIYCNWSTLKRLNYKISAFSISLLLIVQLFLIFDCTLAYNTSQLGVHIVKSPESATAPLGDEVLFECQLNLVPDRLEWRFKPQSSTGRRDDYIYFTENEGHNITTNDQTSKLRVYVNQGSAGDYQCVSWFGAAALASIPAKLTLAAIGLDDIAVPDSSIGTLQWRISPDNSILIKCGSVISNPPPVWIFHKDHEMIPSHVPQLSSGSLILSPLRPSDTGTYWCSAVNSITGVEVILPQKINLRIEHTSKTPPYFPYTPPRRFSARPNSTLLLECPAVGNPTPRPIWSRPDGRIDYNRTKVFNYGLQLINVQPEDNGTYVCRVDNGIAPVLVHTIILDVIQIPKIIEGPMATLTNESSRLELSCIVSGFPQPEIYWMINGANTKWDPLVKQDGNKLTIMSVEKKHAGIVQCFAKNEYGEVSENNLLQVNPKQIPGELDSPPLGSFPQSTRSSEHTGRPPKGHRRNHKHRPVMIPPSRPSITRLSDTSVMVRWSVPDRKGLPIRFFKVQYRQLGDTSNKASRAQWMTSNEDILPDQRVYQVDQLKPDHYYRFRIAAVYSNNDNKVSNTSTKFLLQRAVQLGVNISSVTAPVLTKIEAISETAIVLHWTMLQPKHNADIEGFIAYYRPASNAGEYSKITIDGMNRRHFKIEGLEPGTAYEFKLQSFTSSAASDFSKILTGNTNKPVTSPPSVIRPSVISAAEATNVHNSSIPWIAGGVILCAILVVFVVGAIICLKKKQKSQREEETNDHKSHANHIQTDSCGFSNGVVVSGGRVLGSPVQKNSRLNCVIPRMNITSNPLAQDGDKNRNVMELRFLPNSMAPVGVPQQNNNCAPPLQPPTLGIPIVQMSSMDPMRKTLERSHKNLHHIGGQTPTDEWSTTKMMGVDGMCDVGRIPSMRRPRRSSGSGQQVPGSPRIGRGLSTELLHQNRSPLPPRALSSKRNRLGSRTDNMSSGSLNSIEV